jgi:tRNA (guanine37-N1)-methyltransferase
MEIDVFTLFPEAFAWFERQRHVSNALAHGTTLEYVNYRDHTPLTGGQVDDSPFGGGAGMVLRVDAVEAALRARYDEDPVQLRSRRRVIALTPGGRMLDDGLVNELAAEPALTLLSGRYEGFDERVLESAIEESFSPALDGAPEYPHYSRPAEYRGWRVPEVLLSGHHARIREWRLAQSRARAAEPLP